MAERKLYLITQKDTYITEALVRAKSSHDAVEYHRKKLGLTKSDWTRGYYWAWMRIEEAD